MRLVTLALLAAVGLTATACGRDAPAAASAPSSSPSASAAAEGRRDSAPPSSAVPRARDTRTSPAPSLDEHDGPTPLELPFTNEVPVRATITPTCVPLGATIAMTVHTQPKAGVAYQAVYADERSGAKPPWGAGYGGNDGGVADAEGVWRATWIVSSDAPVGPARVDVFSAAEAKRGYVGIPFRVVATAASC